MADPYALNASAPLPHGLDLIEITPSDSAVLDPMPRLLRIEVYGYPPANIPSNPSTPITTQLTGYWFGVIRVTPANAASNSIGDSILLRMSAADGTPTVTELPCRVRKVWATDTSANIRVHGYL